MLRLYSTAGDGDGDGDDDADDDADGDGDVGRLVLMQRGQLRATGPCDTLRQP